MSRTSEYTEERAASICEALEDGKPLAEWCREHAVGRSSVYRWLKDNKDFAERFAEARVAGFDTIAERGRLTLRGKTEEDGGESTGDVVRDKAIADYDLKLLAKWDPKRWGDRMALDHSGEVGVRHGVDDNAAARLAAIMEAARRRRDEEGGA